MTNPLATKNDRAKLLPVKAKLTLDAAVELGALLDSEEVPVPVGVRGPSQGCSSSEL